MKITINFPTKLNKRLDKIATHSGRKKEEFIIDTMELMARIVQDFIKYNKEKKENRAEIEHVTDLILEKAQEYAYDEPYWIDYTPEENIIDHLTMFCVSDHHFMLTAMLYRDIDEKTTEQTLEDLDVKGMIEHGLAGYSLTDKAKLESKIYRPPNTMDDRSHTQASPPQVDNPQD